MEFHLPSQDPKCPTQKYLIVYVCFDNDEEKVGGELRGLVCGVQTAQLVTIALHQVFLLLCLMNEKKAGPILLIRPEVEAVIRILGLPFLYQPYTVLLITTGTTEVQTYSR